MYKQNDITFPQNDSVYRFEWKLRSGTSILIFKCVTFFFHLAIRLIKLPEQTYK